MMCTRLDELPGHPPSGARSRRRDAGTVGVLRSRAGSHEQFRAGASLHRRHGVQR